MGDGDEILNNPKIVESLELKDLEELLKYFEEQRD
jgi:hypothetical protein